MRPAKFQISLGIRRVWSESSLCAQCVAKDLSFLHADSEDSDRWAHSYFVGLVMSRLKCYCRRKSMQEKKKICNGCSVRIDNSVTRQGSWCPNSYPRDGIFNPHLTNIKDSYIHERQVRHARGRFNAQKQEHQTISYIPERQDARGQYIPKRQGRERFLEGNDVRGWHILNWQPL